MFDEDMEEEIDVFDLEVCKPMSPYNFAHLLRQCYYWGGCLNRIFLVEVPEFFQASFRNCINCVHNCENFSFWFA